MGLDMFIYKVKKTDHTIKELSDLNIDPKEDDPAFAEFLPLHTPFDTMPDYKSIFKQVAYWRKFNALHQWFVTHVQLGIDNCGLYELDQDVLRSCHDVLEEAFYKKNHYILPPTQGFFWGSTEIDDYYWNNVEESIQTISHLIDDTDWATERLFYQSSW